MVISYIQQPVCEILGRDIVVGRVLIKYRVECYPDTHSSKSKLRGFVCSD
jgi:hypothetical protein